MDLNGIYNIQQGDKNNVNYVAIPPKSFAFAIPYISGKVDDATYVANSSLNQNIFPAVLDRPSGYRQSPSLLHVAGLDCTMLTSILSRKPKLLRRT